MKASKPFMGVTKGAVYYYDPDNILDKCVRKIKVGNKEFDSKVLAGTRPYVVISDNNYNEFNGTCVLVPLTHSKLHDYLSKYCVEITGFEKNYTVRVDNPITVDILALTEIAGFLPSRIMKQIDYTMMYLLNPDIFPNNTTNKPMSPSIDTKILLEADQEVLVIPETKVTKKDIIKPVKQEKVAKNKKVRDKTWTEERSRQFLKDCIDLGEVEACKKYGIGTHGSYAWRRVQAKKDIAKILCSEKNGIGNNVSLEPTKIEEVDKESSSVNKPTYISNPPDKKRSRRYDPEFYKEIKSW